VVSPSTITVQRFAFYYTGTFTDYGGVAYNVTLRLQIRNSSGTILDTAQVSVPSTFSGGFVFFENLGFTMNANTTYIFTTYMANALTLGAWSGYAGDSATGYTNGVGYSATVTDADSSFNSWGVWNQHSWDRRFWLQACQ
jgi:hypothetical protein